MPSAGLAPGGGMQGSNSSTQGHMPGKQGTQLTWQQLKTQLLMLLVHVLPLLGRTGAGRGGGRGGQGSAGGGRHHRHPDPEADQFDCTPDNRDTARRSCGAAARAQRVGAVPRLLREAAGQGQLQGSAGCPPGLQKAAQQVGAEAAAGLAGCGAYSTGSTLLSACCSGPHRSPKHMLLLKYVLAAAAAAGCG